MTFKQGQVIKPGMNLYITSKIIIMQSLKELALMVSEKKKPNNECQSSPLNMRMKVKKKKKKKEKISGIFIIYLPYLTILQSFYLIGEEHKKIQIKLFHTVVTLKYDQGH